MTGDSSSIQSHQAMKDISSSPHRQRPEILPAFANPHLPLFARFEIMIIRNRVRLPLRMFDVLGVGGVSWSPIVTTR